MHSLPRFKRAGVVAVCAGLLLACSSCASASPSPAPPPATGGSVRTDDGAAGPVRNQTPRAGEAVTTLRYWKIKKGGFPQFLEASRTGVWPYFEKIGARVVGMWLVVPAPGKSEASRDYDEVYLATRYASIEHWAATRDAASLGGGGPDYAAMRAALAVRRSLTIETNVTFMKGFFGPLPPVFMPGTGETFAPVN